MFVRKPQENLMENVEHPVAPNPKKLQEVFKMRFRL